MSGPENQPIVMYARKRFCPDVERARARLSELGVKWIEHDTEADTSIREEMIAITGRGNVPTLLIGASVLVEPTTSEIDQALEHAGLMPVTP